MHWSNTRMRRTQSIVIVVVLDINKMYYGWLSWSRCEMDARHSICFNRAIASNCSIEKENGFHYHLLPFIIDKHLGFFHDYLEGGNILYLQGENVWSLGRYDKAEELAT